MRPLTLAASHENVLLLLTRLDLFVPPRLWGGDNLELVWGYFFAVEKGLSTRFNRAKSRANFEKLAHTGRKE